jgi:hypothetical protein
LRLKTSPGLCQANLPIKTGAKVPVFFERKKLDSAFTLWGSKPKPAEFIQIIAQAFFVRLGEARHPARYVGKASGE